MLEKVLFKKHFAQHMLMFQHFVSGLLELNYQKTRNQTRKKQFLCRSEATDRKKIQKISLLVVVPILITLLVLAILGLTITSFLSASVSIYIGIAFLFLLFLFLHAYFTIGKSDSTTNMSWYRFSMLIIYALFTQLPIREIRSPYIPATIQRKCTLERPTKEKKAEDKTKTDQSTRR